MVLNLADLGKCRKSLQTPWNASYIHENTFVTAFGIVAMDFGWIRKGPKVADFEQKPYRPWFWTWRIWVSAGNRSKLPETPPKCLKMDF